LGNTSKNKVKKKNTARDWLTVGNIQPVPSPTVMYGILKHYTTEQTMEYK
jgi:hypothetical protein